MAVAAHNLAPGVAAVTAATLLAAPDVTLAQSNEIARTQLYGQEVILRDDGTWSFENPAVKLPALTDPAACLATSDGRIRYCGLADVWPERRVVSGRGFEEHFFEGGNSGFALTVYLDRSFGHDGDPGAFELAESPLMGFILGILSGPDSFPLYEESSALVAGDVVVSLFLTRDPELGHGSAYVEVMSRSETMALDLTTIPRVTADGTFISAQAELEDRLGALLDRMTVDEMPVADLLRKGQK